MLTQVTAHAYVTDSGHLRVEKDNCVTLTQYNTPTQSELGVVFGQLGDHIIDRSGTEVPAIGRFIL